MLTSTAIENKIGFTLRIPSGHLEKNASAAIGCANVNASHLGPSRPKGKNGGNFKLVDGRPSEPGIPTAIPSNLSSKKVRSMAASRFLIFRAISPHFMRHSCAEYARESEASFEAEQTAKLNLPPSTGLAWNACWGVN